MIYTYKQQLNIFLKLGLHTVLLRPGFVTPGHLRRTPTGGVVTSRSPDAVTAMMTLSCLWNARSPLRHGCGGYDFLLMNSGLYMFCQLHDIYVTKHMLNV